MCYNFKKYTVSLVDNCSYPQGKWSLFSSLDCHCSLCLCGWCYRCYCYLMYPCHGGVLCTCAHMAKWLKHTEPALRWGHIMIRQHSRGLGTEGNLLQYDSTLMNSKMAAQTLRKFPKTRALMALKASYKFGTWQSGRRRSNGMTCSVCSSLPTEERLKQ